ncbi:MAG TPA: 5-methyltetrahydropteroyltriglutamate--homocysteine S-methyltransferase [Mycobacteriales bacterium]|nr:5-methyltetrahydropteroyltriglutamate--homocysteine S-methyltransferase [Mycobacteriales bacterium]
MTLSQDIGATVLGYPRIGPDRELKRATEAYWAGRIDAAELQRVGAAIRAQSWQELAAAGLDSIPANSFSYYDQMLDTVALVGAIPPRHREEDALDTYFAMARGTADATPLEMTKWFDTNYHYLVPEIGPETAFALDASKPLTEIAEARELGIDTRPVIIGPLTFLLLSKPTAPGYDPLQKLDELLAVYEELLRILPTDWVQLDEPAFVTDRSEREYELLRATYQRLGAVPGRPRIFVASYFGELGDALPALADTPVEAIGLDLVAGSVPPTPPEGKILVAGVINGRNIWRADLDAALARASLPGQVAISTSCSLQHVPYDADRETAIEPTLRGALAFARQKVAEVVAVATAVREGAPTPAFAAAREALAAHAAAGRDEAVRSRVAALRAEDRERGPADVRAKAQQEHLHLPSLPTTTIGSFPQTPDIRKARAAHRSGKLDTAGYEAAMRAEIERVIRLQEELGLDVLVHGEAERNDMVQYFAEQLTGYQATQHGWVQSYGSRCTRPAILYGDVSRPEPMTVRWTTYAQSLTDKPVKGMLTGPVTMLAWSFVRDDQPRSETAFQVALALRDEVADLERAGVQVIQVDEPALRELLPLRAADRPAYLDWAIGAFRIATSGVADQTQIHTHLCYSEFGVVLDAIEALNADVTSIEAARSTMEVVDGLAAAQYPRGVGPGVYDIHSPRVPDTAEIQRALETTVRALPTERIWVNPDCGLKTRTPEQVTAALRNLVAATRNVRG